MRSVQVSKPKGPFEIVERDVPEPGAVQVRIKVQACGICHSDSLMKEGLFPGIQYPRVPGHEIAGVIDAVGKDVIEWKTGHRVAVGWQDSGAIVAIANPVGGGISLLVDSLKYLVLPTTAATLNTWLRQQKH